jgi:hypothetical protein
VNDSVGAHPQDVVPVLDVEIVGRRIDGETCYEPEPGVSSRGAVGHLGRKRLTWSAVDAGDPIEPTLRINPSDLLAVTESSISWMNFKTNESR